MAESPTDTALAPAGTTALATLNPRGLSPALLKAAQSDVRPAVVNMPDDDWVELSVQQRVDYIADMPSELQITMNDIVPEFTRVKFPSGGVPAWTIEKEPYKEIAGVVVWQNAVRAWWISDDTTGQPPDCSSIDSRTPVSGNGPVRQGASLAMIPGQGPKTCAQCPLSQFGTDKHGRGQACKLKLNFFIWTPGTMLPSFVSCPPTSIRPMNRFISSLANRKIQLSSVQVILGLDSKTGPTGKEYSVISPRLGDVLGYHDQMEAKKIRAQFKDAMTKRGVTEADAEEFIEAEAYQEAPIGAGNVDDVPF
jgi:hypothetical protein